MRNLGRTSRVHVYGGLWILVTVAAIVFRFTTFRGTGSSDRWTMTCVYIFGTWTPLMAANIVEQRRLALAAGLRGRGALGVLRGWVRTAGIELLLNEQDQTRSKAIGDAITEFMHFRLFVRLVFVAYLVVLPLLLF